MLENIDTVDLLMFSHVSFIHVALLNKSDAFWTDRNLADDWLTLCINTEYGVIPIAIPISLKYLFDGAVKYERDYVVPMLSGRDICIRLMCLVQKSKDNITADVSSDLDHLIRDVEIGDF